MISFTVGNLEMLLVVISLVMTRLKNKRIMYFQDLFERRGRRQVLFPVCGVFVDDRANDGFVDVIVCKTLCMVSMAFVSLGVDAFLESRCSI